MKRISISLLLLLPLAARAEIREIKAMAQILPSVDTSTLVVFDIDNTLLEPVGNIGSDQWYYYIAKAGKRDGLNEKASWDLADAAWRKALPTVAVRAVEDSTPFIASGLQQRGVTVMALTARGPEDEADTLRQFKTLGYDLTKRTLVKNGIVLMGDGDKGAVLLETMKKAGYKPKRVIFVDDKLKNVKNVDAALTAAGVPVLCFRYGATDAKVAAFNEVTGEALDKASEELLFHGRSK